MDAQRFITEALDSGRKSLTEAESKTLLRNYDIPVVEEAVVNTPAESASTASSFGYPIVVKAVSDEILHKTEKNLVHLNLTHENAVKKAANRILEAEPNAQILVQPQVKGNRELVAGLYRDPHFGPVILFGLGGVLTEAIADIVLRLAPLTEQDAAEMIDGIKAQSMIGTFRGEKAVEDWP